MRIFLAMGPGDIVGDRRKNVDVSVEGGSGRGETSLTFSGQAVHVLHARGHDVLAVSSNLRRDRFVEGKIETRNLPKPFAGKGGAFYHLSQLCYAIRLAGMARGFGAELAIIDSGTTFWFMLAAFSFLGIPVAVNFHNVRWPHGCEPKSGLFHLIRRLDSWFLRTCVVAAMGCSPECAVQARVDGASRLLYFPWTSQYHSTGFEPERLPLDDGVFHVLFVGRIELGKGVLDLVTMAEQLRTRGKAVHFEVCGDGDALDALRRAVADSCLEGMVTVRGRLERAELLTAYANNHVVIVPTRKTFCEGMPLACAEAMLAGRPVITSVLSNALPVMGAAIAEAEAESIPSYVAVIEQLADDRRLWETYRAATVSCRAQFVDRTLSYAAAMDHLVERVSGEREPPLAYAALFGEGG